MQNALSLTAVLAPIMMSLACQSSPATTSESVNSPNRLEPAKLNPELIEKSEEILHQHRDAPVGTDIPLRINGRRYLARIELHEDETKGKHKGVTLYEVK